MFINCVIMFILSKVFVYVIGRAFHLNHKLIGRDLLEFYEIGMHNCNVIELIFKVLFL